jgi:hypothetical protein
MSLTIYSGTMIPAPIEAVLVTDKNMDAVAAWCGGQVNDGEGTVYVDGPFIGHDVHPGGLERGEKACGRVADG